MEKNKPILSEVSSVSWVRWRSSCPSTSFVRKTSSNCGNPNCWTQFATSADVHFATAFAEFNSVVSPRAPRPAGTGRFSSSLLKERAIWPRFHIMTFLSLEPEARSRLSCEKTQQVTYRVCPSSRLMSWPVPGFQIMMLLSPALSKIAKEGARKKNKVMKKKEEGNEEKRRREWRIGARRRGWWWWRLSLRWSEQRSVWTEAAAVYVSRMTFKYMGQSNCTLKATLYEP